MAKGPVLRERILKYAAGIATELAYTALLFLAGLLLLFIILRLA